MRIDPDKGHRQYQRTPFWDIIQTLNLTASFESINMVRSSKDMFDKHRTKGNYYA